MTAVVENFQGIHEGLEALAQAGIQPEQWTLISTFAPRTSRRPTYRVDLHDGSTVKVRYGQDAAEAQRLESRRQACQGNLPQVRFRWGRVLIEDWIPGTPLDQHPFQSRFLEPAAALLASLHRSADMAQKTGSTWTTTCALRQLAGQRLQTLQDHDALPVDLIENLRETLTRLAPGTAPSGWIHGDFCAENLVVDETGRLHAIDNVDLAFEALDFDLGLVWYRWPLAPPQFERFLQAYQSHSGRKVGSLDFWKLLALIKGAAFRVVLFPQQATLVLDRLAQAATALRDMVNPDRQGILR